MHTFQFHNLHSFSIFTSSHKTQAIILQLTDIFWVYLNNKCIYSCKQIVCQMYTLLKIKSKTKSLFFLILNINKRSMLSAENCFEKVGVVFWPFCCRGETCQSIKYVKAKFLSPYLPQPSKESDIYSKVNQGRFTARQVLKSLMCKPLDNH